MNSIKSKNSSRLFRHMVVFITLFAFMNGATGCTSLVKVPAEEISKVESKEKQVSRSVLGIKSVKLKTGKKIEFMDPGASIPLGSDIIVGTSKRARHGRQWQKSVYYEIHLDDVEYMKFRRPSPWKTSLLIIGLFAGTIILIDKIVKALKEKKKPVYYF